MPKYTVKQAAAALGVSVKTIRRRIAEGALSATKETRGKQELLFIDGAELARHAEVSNLRLNVDMLGQVGSRDNEGNGQTSVSLPEESSSDLDSPRSAQGTGDDLGRHIEDITRQARALEDTIGQLRAALAEARQREVWLQERLEATEEASVQERERASEERQRLLDLIPKLLPPARLTWWQRVFGGKGEAGHG